MERTIYKFIFRYSKRQQIFILCFTLLSLPFYYASLDIPKLIVNNVLTDIPEYVPESMRESATADSVPRYLEVMGIQLGDVDRLHLLAIYCGLFLFLVLMNGGFKWFINVYKGLLGERMLRRLRYQLFSRVLRFPLPHFRRVGSGEIIPMITQEVEPLGGFIGDSIALPLYQGGLLITALVFIFMQDPWMGAAAVSLYPIQGWIIPKLQRQVNLLGKARVKEVRKLSERISETVQSSQEMHANDTMRFELADFAWRMQRIFEIRYDIFRKKFFIKFLNNFLAQLTPFFFYAVGGYLVIQGDLSLGGLVAVLAAYKDLQPPWKELLNFYQIREDSKIKYDQVVTQFAPPGMRDEDIVFGNDHQVKPFTQGLSASNLQYAEDGDSIIDGLTLDVGATSHIAVVGDASSGKTEVALLLAHLIDGTGGNLRMSGEDASRLPEASTGQRIGFVGGSTHLISASLADNLLYGLKHAQLEAREPDDPDEKRAMARAKSEAERTGNTTEDRHAEWIDYAAAGVSDAQGLNQAVLRALEVADMTEDAYNLGLRGTLDPEERPEAAEMLLEARRMLQQRLDDPAYRGLVEPFDALTYNTNATLAENLLFGTPVGDAFDLERLAENAYVMETLGKVGLEDELLDMGFEVAQTMIELFADLPPEHEFFAQFAFISLDDLPDYQAIVRRAERDGVKALEGDERLKLLSLPFKLIPSRHRLGLIDEDIRSRILKARALFAENLPDDLKGSVEFFERTLYNAASSLQDNILFGKLAYGRAQAQTKVGELISEVIAQLDLRPTVIEVGLDFEVGVGGSRLSPAQRQKVAIARAILKRPDIMILSEATAALDGAAQSTILRNIRKECEGRALIWILHRPSQARGFDQVVVMKGGKIVERGRFEDLAEGQSTLADLMAAE